MRYRTLFLAWCLTLAACAGRPAADPLAAFEAANGIRDWPHMQGCGYGRPFGEDVVGVVLWVRTPTDAQARARTNCHVPVRHRLEGWPEALPPGRYVVAVTSEPDRLDARNRHRVLQVVGVLGSRPDDEALIAAALRRICAGPGAAASGDGDCRARD